MARPRKRGLDYFPLDVDIFDNDKIFDVQNEYGPLGETVYLRLVCLVYRNGYYFKFESIEKLAAMVIRSIGNRWVESKNEIVEIIKFLIDCGLFSKRFAEMNILTSKGIQTRFKLATERRRSGIIEYSLIDGGNSFAEDVHENVCGNDISLYDDTEFSEENTNSGGFSIGTDLTEKKADSYGLSESVVDFNNDDVTEEYTDSYNINENNCVAEDSVSESIFDYEYSGMTEKKAESYSLSESVVDFNNDDVTEKYTDSYNINENNCMAEDSVTENISDFEYCGTAKRSVCESNRDYYSNMCDFNDYFKDNTNNPKVTYDTFNDTECTGIVSVYENEGFCCNNPTKKSKVKESKVNKSKVKESRVKESISDTAVEKCDSLSAEKVVSVFNKECGSLPKVTKITAGRVRAVKFAAEKINGDFEGLFKRVEKSDFLTGRNGKWLNCSFDWIFKPSNLSKILNGNYDNGTRTSRRSGGFFFSNTYDNEEEYYESLKKLSPCY